MSRSEWNESPELSYEISIGNLEKTLRDVKACGYGDTIQIIINGEHYDLKWD